MYCTEDQKNTFPHSTSQETNVVKVLSDECYQFWYKVFQEMGEKKEQSSLVHRKHIPLLYEKD
jgi:hypothetical protein